MARSQISRKAVGASAAASDNGTTSQRSALNNVRETEGGDPGWEV